MTETPTADRLEALIAKWRESATEDWFGQYVLEECAEELEAELIALRAARAPLTPLERYDAGHERFQREQIRGLKQTVAALLRQLHRLGCVGRVPSFDVDPEEWASAYDPQTDDTLLHLKSEARAPRPQPAIYESRSPDGDGQSDMTASQQMLSPRIAGSEPADSHSTTAAAPLGGPPEDKS